MPIPNPITEIISADGTPIQQASQIIKQASAQLNSPEPIITSIDALPKEDNKEPVVPASEDSKVKVTIEDFLNAKGNDDIVEKPKPKTEDDKQQQQPKKEDSKETLQTEKEVKTVQDTTLADLAKTKIVEKDGRDYSDIPEEEKPLWRKMSNDSFNKILPQVKELKSLKETLKKNEEVIATTTKQLEEAQKGIVRLPENYTEHPAAFVLTPEFNQISTNINTAQRVYSHWEEQMLALDEGAKEISVLGNDAQGNIVETGKMPVDGRTKLMLGRLISGSERQLANEQARLNILAQSHGQRASEVKNWVNAQEKDAFAIFETPENKVKIAPIIQDTISKFPPALQSNVLISSYAKALITISTLRNMLEAAKAAQAGGNGASANGAVAKVAEIAKRNGPSAGEIAGDGGDVTKNKTAAQRVTIEDFKRAKEGDL